MAKKLPVNEMNRRIIIQHYTTIDVDPEGVATEGWADLMKIWAARAPLRGREFWEAAATNAEKTVRYKIRCRPGILPDMRLVDTKDGQTYNITAVLDDVYGDRTQTHLMTELIQDG